MKLAAEIVLILIFVAFVVITAMYFLGHAMLWWWDKLDQWTGKDRVGVQPIPKLGKNK